MGKHRFFTGDQHSSSQKERVVWDSPKESHKAGIFSFLFHILVALVLVYLVIVEAMKGSPSIRMIFAVLIGVLETIISIQHLTAWVHSNERNISLQQSISQLEGFNQSMRAQRHDLKNHLQVISALLDMDEYSEAKEYLRDVTDDFQVVTRAVRTSQPAVNALLQAKQSICEEYNIEMELEVTTSLDGLNLEAWTFCRILGNLIDNAIDILRESQTMPARILVHLSQAERYYHVRVENNGPPIPEKERHAIFRPGYSSKGEGRGLGLAIVRELLVSHGGNITLHSDQQSTVFSFTLPRAYALS